MVRTALAVVLSTLFVAVSPAVAQEIVPATTLLAAAATTGLFRSTADLATTFETTSAHARLTSGQSIETAGGKTDAGVLQAQPAATMIGGSAIASRQPGRPLMLVPLYAGLIALQSYDVYSTTTALKMGAQETNPLLGAVTQNPASFAAIKAVMTGMSIFASERLWRQHHRVAAIAVMAISNSMMATVAAHNASVIGKLR